MKNNLYIGKGVSLGKQIYINVCRPQTNGHFLLIGESGSGKTYGTQVLVEELADSGGKIIILDLSGSLTRNQGEEAFFSYIEQRLNYVYIARSGIPLNIFERLKLDEESDERDCDIAGRVVVSLEICIGKGLLQRNILYEAIKKMLCQCECGKSPSLELLKHVLQNMEDTEQAKKLIGKINPLIDGNYFRDAFSEGIMEQESQIELVQMQSIPAGVKKVITDLILWRLWSEAVKYGNKNEPIYVLIDEFQNARTNESAPLCMILQEGRRYGLNLILSTQFLRGRYSDGTKAALEQIGNKILFKPSDSEVRSISKYIAQGNGNIQRYERELRNLKQGQAILSGSLCFSSEPETQSYPKPLKVRIITL